MPTRFFSSPMQRRLAHFCLLLALAGCGGGNPFDAPRGDAEALAATWRVELRERGCVRLAAGSPSGARTRP